MNINCGLLLIGALSSLEYVRCIVLGFIVAFVVLSLIFGVLVIRYQNKRNKQKQLLRDNKHTVPHSKEHYIIQGMKD